MSEAASTNDENIRFDIQPELPELLQMIPEFRLFPLTLKLKADTITPISVFQILRTDSPCFLLESAEGSDKQARYSIIGRKPLLSLKADATSVKITIRGEDYSENYGNEPVIAIRRLLKEFRIPDALATDSYRCALTGYFSYDFVRYIEEIPDNNPDTIKLPDCDLMAPEQVIVYDHLRHEMTLVQNILLVADSSADDLKTAYDKACQELVAMKKQLTSGSAGLASAKQKCLPSGSFHSSMSRDEYMEKVNKAKTLIRAGDIFQAVISQRFSSSYSGDAFSVYRSLRNVSPSPYLFFLQFENVSLAGASPEMLVRLNRGKVETSPIAGTRKRGSTAAEDEQLRKELLADTKEMAEHAMLTDLARNDIGRICKFGSVKVSEYANVEMYSHVMHIVSQVEGRLTENKSAIDVLCALLPAGTLSGAPKIRAMEIIDELETVRRGPYGGATGYLSFDGSMNTCITIRTALIQNGKIHVQAGAGIVADSNPESEYSECVNKAAALIAAIEQAGEYE